MNIAQSIRALLDKEGKVVVPGLGIFEIITKPVYEENLFRALLNALSPEKTKAEIENTGQEEKSQKVKPRFDCRVLLSEDNPVNRKTSQSGL